MPTADSFPRRQLPPATQAGRSLGAKNGSRVDKQRAGQRAAAVLRAKPAAERAAMLQKGWATRRANAAAAQLAELESDSKPPTGG